jgi:3-hydroxyisobutyrate dehydrogenase-like beta-hydroxyacid dehydrogenase
MQKIAMLGLGIMGTPVAKNILKAGFELTVWNRNKDKCAPLLKLGATSAETPEEAAKEADITLCMVSDPKAAKAVALGPKGAIEGLSAGKAYIDFSTVDSQTAITIGTAVTKTGAKFLEAPVSGSKKPAEDATLIILCGGDKELFMSAQPLLKKISKASYYLGETGQGAKMKLVVNMVMGAMMASLSEGLALAEKAKLDLTTLLEVVDGGAMSNPMFRGKGPAMIKGVFPTAFPLKHMQKDMRLACALGDQLAQPLPVIAAANQQYIKARKSEHGEEDFSAVYRVTK